MYIRSSFIAMICIRISNSLIGFQKLVREYPLWNCDLHIVHVTDIIVKLDTGQRVTLKFGPLMSLG